MTKTFCDVCGKEFNTNDFVCTYNIDIRSLSIASKTKRYADVCKDCAENIRKYIDSLKEKANG